MDVAGAGIAHAAEIALRADCRGQLPPVEEGEVSIAEALGHDVGMAAVGVDVARLVGGRELAGLIVDVDAVRLREVYEVRLGLLGEVEQRLGAFEAELGLQLLRPCALAGAELPAIAPRRPVAEAVLLDQHHVEAGPGEMVRGRQARVAAADDGDVGGGRAVERRIGGALADAVLIPGAAGGDGGLVGHGLRAIGQ